MNVHPLVKRLQEIASQTTDSFELMVLAKAIEKIKVGAVRTVATFGDLPTLPLAEDGELFLVEADEDLYFNVGSTWDRFRPFVFDAMSWGLNNQGQVGDGTVTINRSSPVTVIGGITNWSYVSAVSNANFGIVNGIAYTWGANFGGALGDGTRIDRSSPVTVVGGITNWSKGNVGTAITDDGIAYAWGSNGAGQCGDGTVINRSSPVTVVGGITDWSSVSKGNNHSIGITGTGVAYTWGTGGNGRLGDGTTVAKSSPVTVIGGITNWSQVSAGNAHSLGVTDTGIAYAWGAGSVGRLGDGTAGINRSSPVTVVGGITNWSQVSAGGDHSLGLTDTGVAYAWGFNNQGQVGDGTTISKSSPVTVVGGITNWSQVSAGEFRHNLGITNDGALYGWGIADAGQIGEGTRTNKSSPVTVVGGITNWSQVGVGFKHSIAIKSQ